MSLKHIALSAALFGFACAQCVTQGRAADVSSAGFAGCGITRSGAKLIFASGASPASPCIFAINDFPVSVTSPSEIAIAGAGSGAVVVFISSAGAPSILYNGSLKLSITGGKMAEGAVPAPSFPPGSLPLASAIVKDGQWEKLQDRRPAAGSRDIVTAGKGIASINRGVIAVDSTIPQTGASNVWVGQNDFSAGTSLVLPRKNGDPSTGCSSPADVGKVHVRGDGPTGNNLWICENNGGTRRWARLTTLSLDLPGQGYFVPGGRLVDAGFQPLSPMTSYFYQVVLPYPIAIRHLRLMTGGGGTATQAAAAGIYDANCKLVTGAAGRAVGLASQGGLTITLAAQQNLAPGVYYFGYATDSATATFDMGSNGVAEAALLNLPQHARLFTGGAPTGTGPSLSLPASCGTQSAKAFPTINFAWLP